MRFLDALVPARRYGQLSGFDEGSVFSFAGNTYVGQPWTSYGRTPAEPIGADFPDLVRGALQADGVVSAVELIRFSVFSEARFQWQGFNNGRPGDLFGSRELEILEHPFPGGTTGDLLARMLLHADFAGNAYTAKIGGELVQLRPDWTDIVLAPRMVTRPGMDDPECVGMQRVGYAYYECGDRQDEPVVFLPDEVAHFAPYPDPLATYRGMSWLTPIVREIQSDKAATTHKLAFWENAATPNLAVSLPREVTSAQFAEFVEAMDRSHKGAANAYKTLYTAGGADVTVVGADMRQMDFKAVQGASETRIAAAAGVGAILANLSEGMQGSSLNAGNYNAAKRRFADGTMRPLWRNVAASLEVLLTNPNPATRLWYDDRDIAFLRDDQSDVAAIQAQEAQTIRQLIDSGFTPESVKAAVAANDWTLLAHSGLYSVQLQSPGSVKLPESTVPATVPAA